MSFTNHQINSLDLPLVQEIALQAISTNFKKILVLNYLITVVVLSASVYGLSLIKPSWLLGVSLWYVIAFFVIISVFIFSTYLFGFKYRKYALREKDLTYSIGFLVNTMTIIPHNRIQHTEVSRSFIERKLGLASLSVFSAGESGGDIKIRGLEQAEAQHINTYLTSIINEQL